LIYCIAERRWPRAAFTVLEILAVLGCLSVVLVVLAEIGLLSAYERKRASQRQEALEAATNILEIARAGSWESLTPAWAEEQRLPDSLAQRLYHGKLKVQVEPAEARPLVKKVTVQIDWQLDSGTAARPVALTGWFAARSANSKGGQP
jgi:type II secretory pathway pseudopilin PulG